MVTRRTLMLCTLVLFGHGAFQLQAQVERQDASPAITMAVEAILDSLSISRDSGESFYIDLSGLRGNLDREPIAERLGMVQATRSDVFHCPPMEGRRPDRNCLIEGADYLVTIHDFSMANEASGIKLEIQGEHEGEGYRSVWSGGWSIALERSGGEWLITEIKPLWER